MSINITLFKLLKNHDWDKFKELIIKQKNGPKY